MSTQGGATNESPGFGIRIKCPKCGFFVMPKNQNLARSILQQGFEVGMKCSHCGCEFMYDRARGEVNAIEGVVDTTSLFMAPKADPIEAKLKKAQKLDAERKPTEVLALLRECETEVRRKGDQQLLQAILGNQAAALADIGQIAEAALKLDEQKTICERIGEKKALGQAVVNQGILMIRGLGKTKEGVVLLAEGMRRCREAGQTKALDQGLAVFRATAGELMRAEMAKPPSSAGDLSNDTLAELQTIGREFGEEDICRQVSKCWTLSSFNKILEGAKGDGGSSILGMGGEQGSPGQRGSRRKSPSSAQMRNPQQQPKATKRWWQFWR